MSENVIHKFDYLIAPIRDDHTSSAQALTVSAGEKLISIIEQLPRDMPSGQILEILAKLGRNLVKAQPSIAPIRKLMKALLRELEEPSSSGDLHSRSILFIERYCDWLRDIKYRIAHHAAPLLRLKKKIVTHSLSNLVFETFREAKLQKIDFEVIATESRPVYEGRILSRLLAEFDVSVTLIVDAAAPGYVEQSDLLLLGADRITQSEFINKIGTLALVLAAHSMDVPCYVLCGSDKYIPEREEPITLSSGSRGEVWQEAPARVTIANPYFERIPLRYITGIISEYGIMPFSEFAQQQGPFFTPSF